MQQSWPLKKMTLFGLVLVSYSLTTVAALQQQRFGTHLRLILDTPPNIFKIVQQEGFIRLETYHIEAFEKLVGSLTKNPLDQEYVKKVEVHKKNFPQEPASVSLILTQSNIRLFDFYQSKDKRHVVDLWVDEDKPARKIAASQDVDAIIDEKPKEKIKNTPVKRKKNIKLTSKANPEHAAIARDEIKKDRNVVTKKIDDKYRDFRYGASFIWNYDALSPTIQRDINLASKTPEFFYKVEDRKYLEDKKESHMQLSINFYRNEKWGMMNKSIRLYEQRYGVDANHELNEFLKANALLKKNIRSSDRSIVASAVNILEGIASRTQDYELIRAITRYIIQFSLDNKNYVKALENGKNLFVLSRKNHDPDMKEHAVNVILFSLAKLKQLDKINEFLDDKYVTSTIASQRTLAYKIYVSLKRSDEKKVIELYEKNKESIDKTPLASILYNVAEAHFRLSNFSQAVKLYDKFAANYSFYREAANARLRMALCYDLLDRETSKVIALYRHAIDRSTSAAIRYEAKIRYASMFLARKKEISEEDQEKTVFLNASDDEKNFVDKKMKKLLWQVRLRYFINSGQYKKAMTYLESIPLQSLDSSERQSFVLDGSEVLHGMIKEYYNKSSYPNVVKTWSLFKEQYSDNLKVNPFVRFYVADSYLQLGLNEKFKKEVALLNEVDQKSISRYPIWIERKKDFNVLAISNELKIQELIQSQQGEDALRLIASAQQKGYIGVNPWNYYKGLINYHAKNYRSAAKIFEGILTKNDLLISESVLDTILEYYTQSLFNVGEDKKLRDVVDALAVDFSENKISPSAKQRIHYLNVESLARAKVVDFSQLEAKAKFYVERYSESLHYPRVKYLLGWSKIRNNKLEVGQKLLTELIDDDVVPDYIKGMAKSELSITKIDNMNL